MCSLLYVTLNALNMLVAALRGHCRCCCMSSSLYALLGMLYVFFMFLYNFMLAIQCATPLLNVPMIYVTLKLGEIECSDAA